RYLHSTGASAFFIVVYLHMFRALLYGSHRGPRELVWLLGCVIFVALMAESFMGYLLPWGNMSYWGAQVIISLFDAIPYIGPGLAEWIRGDFNVSDATLNRFFAFHVILIPLILVALVFLHLVALHKVGSNNPDGIEIKKHKDANGVPLDGIPFHPYYTVKDIVGVVVFLILFCMIVFWAPELRGFFLEHDNFLPANVLQTPTEIKPLWYFTPFYSILRAATDDMLRVFMFLIPVLALIVIVFSRTWIAKLGGLVVGGAMFLMLFVLEAKVWGVFLMGWSIVLLFLLPWLDQSPVKSIRYRGWIYKSMLTLFVISFFILGYMGMKNPDHIDLWWFKNVRWAQVTTVIYFLFFLLLPFYSRWDSVKPEPERVTFE
ncbi:MAG: cytochrome bc complex cytochrome b subunit, partial [Saprospiraceae bacterium]|nr:cytochrome bc complex cytochrome b subunit [Saprospiraceae bacterium]